jgi:hypothetical protein
MANIKSIIFLIIVFLSCEKSEENNYVDFLRDKDRIGTWKNNDMQDIIKVLNDSVLIRYFSSDTNSIMYRICDSIIYMKSEGSTIETKHKILNVKDKQVTIDNMYIMPHDIMPKKAYGVFVKFK